LSKIKTREAIKDIKVLDKTATAAERMKNTFVRTKDSAEHTQVSEHDSPSDYAIDKIKNTTEDTAGETAHQAKKQGGKALNKAKEAHRSSKEAKRAADSVKGTADGVGDTARGAKKASDLPKEQMKKRALDTAKRSAARVRQTAYKPIKTAKQAEKTIKQSARASGKTIKSTAKGTVKTARKSIKTAEKTAKTTIKTTQQATKIAQKTAQTTAKAAKRAAQASRAAVKAAVRATKVAVRATIATIKAIIAATKELVSAIAAGGWIAVLIILIVVLLGGVLSLVGGGSDSSSYTPVSAEVEAYEPLIRKYAAQHGISEYVELIKAVMMQESGGKGNDPMQASECGYNTRYPNTPGGITDPEYSVNVGIQNLAACLKAAEVENPIDMDNIKTALQGYNYGNGYISWAKSNYGGYTYANAVTFSTMMAERLGWSSYGDTQYVSHVLQYYPFGKATGMGSQAIVEVALSQEGNVGGEPYWSWYGFDSRVAWCACFVSWCAEQCGYIDAGIIPRFSLCTDGVSWFKAAGQWQNAGYTPKAGDIIFFDWGNDGSCDHVGIVEYAENGVVHTIEGNSSDSCRRKSYSIGDHTVIGYGTPVY